MAKQETNPRYVYLDKFQRYMIRTDTMLQNLESQQMKQFEQIKALQYKNVAIGIRLRFFITVLIIETVLVIMMLVS